MTDASTPHSDLLAEGRRIAGWAPDKPESVHEVLCSAFKQLDAQYAALQAAIELIQNERDGLEEQFDSVLSLAEHLFQMIPQEVWRDHGAEWMGQYEGDHHAEQVLEQLRAWRGSNPAGSHPTLDDRNPASVVGVPWNEQGYAGSESSPASEPEGSDAG